MQPISSGNIYHCHLFFSSCSIVRSFEGIVSMFAQQPGDQTRIPFMTENILLVTELVSLITP